ncbi:RHS repeat-associated core domain-containing protein [Frankia sp. CNm7]|uniref:RHS repeat-associated core domain-containing protein n=1 Tax=Frankia nepalensis TaxID=1836974 RepID=A0A937UR07_9ACTN|nr:DUF6531 domain-containing protein [Frankia nepalensis]MBL7498110.1 RHS repeat-associated core domain-containing protein [Frankia nepalensis]MBL7509275.1 RHS repeat-associated core domain-containing protein [Frankia nepalensis]MBL7522740.1 RHS repeat-associated core domain-containing protein [Frankia nepalensis]MBL7630812.1 RHS repeat-associated core domain-containing protein [Frankia nepalensis]
MQPPTLTEQGGAPNPSERQPECALAGPVNCASGAFWAQFTDFSLPAPGGPLELVRTYSSVNAGKDVGFGLGWSFNYGMKLEHSGDGTVVIYQENGSTVTFTVGADGEYEAPPRVLASLRREGDTHVLTRRGGGGSFGFDANGQLQWTKTLSGERTDVVRGVKDGYPALTVGRPGSYRKLVFRYDAAGRHIEEVIEEVGVPKQRTATFVYTDDGELDRVTEPDTVIWDFRYDEHHLLEEEIKQPGTKTSIEYYPDGRVESVRELARKEPTRFTYVGTPFTTPPGGSATATAPSVSATRATPSVTATANATMSPRPSSSSPSSGVATPNAGGATTMTDPAGHVTSYVFDGQARLTELAEGAGGERGTIRYSYPLVGDVGLPTAVVDQRGKTTTYEYDDAGNIATLTDPLGRTTTYTYTEDGRPESVTLPSGVTSFLVYDDGGLATSVDAEDRATGYDVSPDHLDQVTSIAEPGRARTSFTYDPVTGDLVGSVQGTWQKTLSGYGRSGELTCQVMVEAEAPDAVCEEAKNPTRYSYDDHGRLASVTSGDATTAVTYDTFQTDPEKADTGSSATTVTDAAGYITKTRKDFAGRTLDTQRSRDGATPAIQGVVVTYNDDDTPRTVTDAAGNATEYAYDTRGRIRQISDILRGRTRYEYDLAGNLVKLVHSGDGGPEEATEYRYDDANQLVGISYSVDRTSVHFEYTSDGHRGTMKVGEKVTGYYYDCAGRVLAVVHGDRASDAEKHHCKLDELPELRGGEDVGYRYDEAGRRVEIIYPGNRRVLYDYSLYDDRRVVEVTDWKANRTRFAYAPDGLLSEITYPNGVRVTYTQNEVVVHKTGGDNDDEPMATFTYQRNEIGQITQTTIVGPGVPEGWNDTFDYQPSGQLASINCQPEECGGTYAYHGTGGITRFPDGTQIAIDPQGRITGQTRPGKKPVNSFAYNGSGARTRTVRSDGQGVQLGYDQEDRLTGYDCDDDGEDCRVHYTYDGDGLLVGRTQHGRDTVPFTWDVSGKNPLLIGDGVVSYLYGPGGEPFEQVSGDSPTYLITDPQRSVRLVTDPSGEWTASYTYSPYGHVDFSEVRGAGSLLQFNGQYTDHACNCQYLRARFYDLDTAAFFTPDPELATTGTPYGFAGGDPLNRVDPSGQFPEWLAATVVRATVLAVNVLSSGTDLPGLAAFTGAAGELTDLVDFDSAGEVIGAVAQFAGGPSTDNPNARSPGATRKHTWSKLRAAGSAFVRAVKKGVQVISNGARWIADKIRSSPVARYLGPIGDAYSIYQECVGPSANAAGCGLAILSLAGGPTMDAALTAVDVGMAVA